LGERRGREDPRVPLVRSTSRGSPTSDAPTER
jgi:hypothetical protein